MIGTNRSGGDLLNLVHFHGNSHAKFGEQNADNIAQEDAIDAQGDDHGPDDDPVVLRVGIARPARTVDGVRHERRPCYHHQQW